MRQRHRAKRVVVAEEVKSKVIRFRITEKDFKAIFKEAHKRDSTVSLFIIECLREKINGLS